MDNLFEGIPKEDIEVFSCSHVMPKENLLTLCVGKGPSNVPFKFNYQNRNTKPVMNELGSFLANIAQMVPDGMVVFFPSYRYLETVLTHWKSGPLYERMASKKFVCTPTCLFVSH